MSRKTDVLIDQIKETCQITGARWAARLERTDAGWLAVSLHGLRKKRRGALLSFLALAETKRWLDKASGKKRMYYRSLGPRAESLGCQKVFVFGHPDSELLLMVGADELTREGKGFFRVLALSLLGEGVLYLSALADTELSGSRKRQGADSFDTEGELGRILTSVGRFLPVEAGYLAVRSGEVFHVEAAFNLDEGLQGREIALHENDTLREMVKTRCGVFGEGSTLSPEGEDGSGWMASPLVIGRRVIGYMAFRGADTLTASDLQRADTLAGHVTMSVDKTMVFVEAARHLQRFALLNELAAVASAGLDLDEVIWRVRRMLVRTFRTERVSLMLLSPDGRGLYDYTEADETRVHRLEESLAGLAVREGKPVRVGESGVNGEYADLSEGVQSVLAVPLKFRRKVIGSLKLESEDAGAFSEQDEKFLVVIGSQISGLVENARLNDEARQRAHNLTLINNIVQRVVGLTDVREIVRLAAQLIGEHFGYELVTVMLPDKSKGELVAEGIGGSQADEFPQGMRYAKQLGTAGQVLEDGISRLVEDAGAEPDYFSLPGWEPGSALCVALREGDDIFGVINVESQAEGALTENDLVALEALAGVLSSVMMYARRYDQLELNVRQLEAVRETALDISTDLDLDVLLRRVVSRVRDLVDARGAELGLLDEDERVVQVLVSDNPWQDYTGYIFPLMSGVGGRVAAMGEPLVVADYNAWSGKSSDDHKAPFTTVAGVPLKLSGEIIGTLTVQDDRPGRSFGPDDVQVLQLLSPQVAIFIRNARLYQELEERMEAQRLAETRLIRSAKLAAVGEMAAGVAHELNNPLTTVTGFAELLQDEIPEDSRWREDIELVLQEARRARGVVRRLLDFSRQGEFLRAEAEINEVVSDVLALVHHLARTSGVEMRIELWDDLPPVKIDRNQIQQVFLNLIHNAIQAMPQGGEMVVRTAVEAREGQRWVAVSVRDSGEGISEEDLGRIFEPFYTTKPSGSGTGLGLSISYGIVADHGGFIDVESQPGEGSVFTVWLPVEMEREGVNA